jgi:hypothetical protein
MVIQNGSLYDACDELFTGYPLAADDCGGASRSIVLMLQDGDAVEFFVLVHECDDGKPFFSFRSWRAGGIVDIVADCVSFPAVVVNAVTHGIPIPRHGSLFGWRAADAVIALIAIYADYSPACPLPSWAVMPLVGVPEEQWPPFTEELFLGQWFWEYYRVGSIVSLDRLVAEMRDTIFWVETEAILGWDCCAVAHDVESPDGYALCQGRYTYYRALRTGKPVPPLQTLLADNGKNDMAPLFQLCVKNSG